jgi:hypothetical protein
MIRLALYSALSDRAAEGRVALIDEWSFPVPRTKDAVAALAALELEGRILVVLDPDDGIADRSFANLQNVQTVQVAELNAYDILRCDWVVFTDATVPGETEPAAAPADEAPRPARRAPAKKAASTATAASVKAAAVADDSADTAADDSVEPASGDEADSDGADGDATATDEGSDQ